MKGHAYPAFRPSPLRIVLAWGVHLYTALGLVCAAGMVVLILQGGDAAFRGVFWLMLLATIIDATDGTLARLVRIKEVLPGFDGRRLDDLIDFLTYVGLPLLLIWKAGLLPAGTEAWLLLPLLAAAYGFCQAEAKTAEGHFLGFPSYWNLIAFYLYALGPLPGWFSLGAIIVPAVLTFVPSLYLYPSQRGWLNRLGWMLGAPWALLLGVVLWQMGSENGAGLARELALLSLVYPAYYLAASWAVTILQWRKRRARAIARAQGREEAIGESMPKPPALSS
jgi:phosphatidylcholine synthase